MTARRLTPATHMLKSKRARSWTLSGALAEMVDNSIGHGHAKNITIKIDNLEGFMVEDDGIGVDDINRIFGFGDSSAYSNQSNIGQYGIGATDATTWLGYEVSVATIRDGRLHSKTIDWKEVEASGEWPYAYDGKGKPTKEPTGTAVMMMDPVRTFQANTVEATSNDLGRIFAPALRNGVKIEIHHQLKKAKVPDVIIVTPFTPGDLTDETLINGVVETPKGAMAWSGRAGLSESLKDKHNGVHISFGHRVIETTREPFGLHSAPTLYVEVALDSASPWKYALSDHKNRVETHRDGLMVSIAEQIQGLLEKSAKQTEYLALKGLTAPLEAALTKALKGIGILHVEDDCDEAALTKGIRGGGTTPTQEGGNKNPGDPDCQPVDEGTEAKESPSKPTGVFVSFEDPQYLEGKLYDWNITGKLFMLRLDAEAHKNTTQWPLNFRDRVVAQLVCSYLASAIASECLTGEGLATMLNANLRTQLEAWVEQGSESKIAPLLNRSLLTSVSV